MVFHDETLDRVTDGTGPVESLSLAELREVSILDTGESIPRLIDLFETVPSTVGLNLELKRRDLAADTVAVAARYDHEVIVSSFDPGELAAAADAGAPSLAYLFAADDPADFAVADAHARGLAVNAWTAESESEARALRGRGVDGIVIEDCELAAVCRDE